MTRLRGSEYLVRLEITQWIGSPSVDKSAIWFGFLITYFRRYLERSGGVLVNIPFNCNTIGNIELNRFAGLYKLFHLVFPDGEHGVKWENMESLESMENMHSFRQPDDSKHSLLRQRFKKS